MPNELEKAYIAGFIDGEGCITFNKDKKRKQCSLYLEVAITHKTKEPLELLKSNYKGSLYFRKNRNYYDYQLRHQQAYKLLKDIFPYLIVKKKQAELSFKFAETMKFKGRRKIPLAIINKRLELKEMIQNLNSKMGFALT